MEQERDEKQPRFGTGEADALAADRRDAERYRWLRKGFAHSVHCTNRKGNQVTYFVGDRSEAVDFGAKLDAAMES